MVGSDERQILMVENVPAVLAVVAELQMRHPVGKRHKHQGWRSLSIGGLEEGARSI